MSPMCGVGAAHSAGSRRRAGTQNGRQCWPGPVWTPTISQANPIPSLPQLTSYPDFQTRESQPIHRHFHQVLRGAELILIPLWVCLWKAVIVTRKYHYWAQHDPNSSHELLFHDNSLMRFPNPSFNFFLATVRPAVEQLIEASFAHFSTARPQTFFRRPRPIKHDQSCYIADSYVI